MTATFSEVVERVQSGTHAVIDLDAYGNNVQVLRSMVGADVALMAVVKADGYGHGAVECGRAAIDAGAGMLGVARISEALHLRRVGLACPIVVIGPPAVNEISLALRHDITLAVGSRQVLAEVVANVERGGSATVHVKVDTGMHRYGFDPGEVVEQIQRLAGHTGMSVEGVFSHFTSADELDESPTVTQIDRFWSVVHDLDLRGLRPAYVHMANSAAVLTGRVEGTNLVRCGIATYGLSPSGETPVDSRFRPALSLRSRVARRGVLSPGDGVSYGLSYRADAREQIAAIPVGYADGLPRGLSNRGWFVINGRLTPIRGRVCMDQIVVSVAEDVAEGDEVVIFGDGSGGEMTLDDIATMAGTNNYEVATRMMARVPRVYCRDRQPVAWESVLAGERGRIEG